VNEASKHRTRDHAWPGAELEDLRILAVTDSTDHRASTLRLLWFLQWTSAQTDIDIEALVPEGPLANDFSLVARTHPVDVVPPADRRAVADLGHFDVVIVTSTASASVLDLLEGEPGVVIFWGDDLGTAWSRSLPLETTGAAVGADWFVSASSEVTTNLVGGLGVHRSKVLARPGWVAGTDVEPDRGARLRADLGIPSEAVVMGGLGTRGWSTGSDLFVQLLDRVRAQTADIDVHGIWVGGSDPSGDGPHMDSDADLLHIGDRLHLLCDESVAPDLLNGIDIYCLTAREDPFPLNVLRAGALGVPVVGFERGSAVDQLADGASIRRDAPTRTVPYLDVEAFAEEVALLARDPAARRARGEDLAGWVRDNRLIGSGAPALLEDLRVMVRSPRPAATRPGGRSDKDD